MSTAGGPLRERPSPEGDRRRRLVVLVAWIIAITVVALLVWAGQGFVALIFGVVFVLAAGNVVLPNRWRSRRGPGYWDVDAGRSRRRRRSPF